VKRRWKVVAGAGAVMLVAALVPIVTIETTCRSPIAGLETRGYNPIIKDAAWQREESRTWLTYPEWHIVYSAESFAQHLRTQPPSSYHYWRDVRSFWSGYCAMNKATAGRAGADARVMLYTIGLSYSAELLVKALYENTLGRIAEWIGGWKSADDRYAAQVQQQYGAFMHETPWYEFPFGNAFSRLWKTSEPHATFRHWERRLALSAEYGVKTAYAKLIGWASGASLGRDERMLRFVARGSPDAIQAIDLRLKAVAKLDPTATLVEAPRYAQFTELVGKMADKPVQLVEISGNDDLFVTLLLPRDNTLAGSGLELFTIPIEEPAGWRRMGVSTKVPQLLDLIRRTRASGGRVEHVYDY
jgi:hypothetical protein